MREFKFLQLRKKQFKVFNLNVMSTDVFGRIPSYGCPFDSYDNITVNLFGTVDDLINDRFNIVGNFTTLIIMRGAGGDVVEITYNNVDGVNERSLVFAREDSVIVRYKLY